MNWAIWLIFGGLIAVLIAFLVFTFFKDKRKNRKIIEKKLELKRATVKSSKELAIKIYTLIEKNDLFLKEVKPGSSKVKMKNVNSIARFFLKEIYDSKAFRTLYIESDEADPNYSVNVKKLIDTNSNLWNKYCQNEIKYFKNFHDELINDSGFEEIKSKSQDLIDDLFKKEVGLNEHIK